MRRVGKYKESQSVLSQSLAIAENLQSPILIADTLISLGDTARLQEEIETAHDFYQRAVAESTLPDIKIKGKLSQLNLLLSQNNWTEAIALVPEIESILNELPSHPTAVYGRINLAKNLLKNSLGLTVFNLDETHKSTANHLATAIKIAREIGDKRAEAEALGSFRNFV